MEEATSQTADGTPPFVIESIATHIETARECRRRINEEGVVVRDMRGAVIPHPAIDIEKTAIIESEKLISKYPPSAHKIKMESFGDDTASLARYLGECGIRLDAAKSIIGRALKQAEIKALEDGANMRRLEIQSIELASARNGKKSFIEDWMYSKP